MRVFQEVNRSDLPQRVKPIDSTWALKKKSNGVRRGRLTARGFKQIDGVDYDSASIHAPVTNAISVRLVLTLMLMGDWTAEVVDVKGAFLHGQFTDGERVYMEVPKGWREHYNSNSVLLLLRTIYGLKQAAMAFWKELLKAMKEIGMERSKADPCMYFSWTQWGLVIIISWIDDNMIVGSKEAVKNVKKMFMEQFECDDVGPLNEYVGNALEYTADGGLKFTQPVPTQSYIDEFEINTDNVWKTPAEAGSVLTKGGTPLNSKDQTYIRKGIGKLLYQMQWSRACISQSTRDLTKHMDKGTVEVRSAMRRVMEYVVCTPNRGVTLKPNCKWDGSKDFKFTITGRSDTDYAKDPDTRRSVTGVRTSVCGSVTHWRSSTQRSITISVTEAEQAGAVTCAQDMIYQKHILESIGLQVALPMILECDNKGAVDLANNWTAGGRTRHVNVRQNWLRELK